VYERYQNSFVFGATKIKLDKNPIFPLIWHGTSHFSAILCAGDFFFFGATKIKWNENPLFPLILRGSFACGIGHTGARLHKNPDVSTFFYTTDLTFPFLFWLTFPFCFTKNKYKPLFFSLILKKWLFCMRDVNRRAILHEKSDISTFFGTRDVIFPWQNKTSPKGGGGWGGHTHYTPHFDEHVLKIAHAYTHNI